MDLPIPNLQKHRDVAEALTELWPLIRDLPSLYVESMDAKSKREAYQLGQMAHATQQLTTAVQWYVLRVTDELVSLVRPEQEAQP